MIQSATIVEQTDQKLVVEVVATDNVQVMPFRHGNQDLMGGVKTCDTLGDQQVLTLWRTDDGEFLPNTTKQVKMRFTVNLAECAEADYRGDYIMGGDTHRIVFTARDSSGEGVRMNSRLNIQELTSDLLGKNPMSSAIWQRSVL